MGDKQDSNDIRYYNERLKAYGQIQRGQVNGVISLLRLIREDWTHTFSLDNKERCVQQCIEIAMMDYLTDMIENPLREIVRLEEIIAGRFSIPDPSSASSGERLAGGLNPSGRPGDLNDRSAQGQPG